MNEILFEMFSRGFSVFMGPHDTGYDGFYAVFTPQDCADDFSLNDVLWFDVGHGESLLEAVQMARALALGEQVDIPRPESFLP